MNDRLKFRVFNKLWDCYSMDDFYIDKDGDLNILGSEYIVEQCTGLKDKNGNPIYEGDILGYKDYTDKRVVVWDNKYMAYRVHDEDNVDCGSIYQEYIGEFGIEVIGNIHEDKELLK